MRTCCISRAPRVHPWSRPGVRPVSVAMESMHVSMHVVAAVVAKVRRRFM